MNDGVAGRVITLAVLLAALVSAVLNVIMRGALGKTVFAVADLPLVLPPFRDDYLAGIGSTYGLFWPLLLAGLFFIAVMRPVPERRRGTPALYRVALLSLGTVLMSVALALPYHLYGLWMTHREYGLLDGAPFA